MQRLSRYASQGRSARAVLTRKHNHPSTQAPPFFALSSPCLPRRVYLPDSSARLAIQAHVTISVNNQITSARLDTTVRPPLPLQEAASRRCGCCLKRLARTHAFACRNARQQTVKSDKVDVVVVVCIPPLLNKRPRPASGAYYTSLHQPLTQTSHHQILLCRHVIITSP